MLNTWPLGKASGGQGSIDQFGFSIGLYFVFGLYMGLF
jgi:hypothetical protein